MKKVYRGGALTRMHREPKALAQALGFCVLASLLVGMTIVLLAM